MRFWRDITTGKDGDSFDVGRAYAVAVCMAGLFFMGWDVIVHATHFDFQSFGIGVGAMAAGIGALLKLKEGSEPHPPEDPPKE